MKKNYEAPQIEVIEIEIEDAILSTSGVETTSLKSFTNGEVAF